MAYTNRTIRLDFPDLGDDIYVSIKNPMLMPISVLQTETEVKLNSDGTPENPADAIRGSFEIAAKLISSWNVYDPMDMSDDPQPIPLPATADKMATLPQVITMRINEFAGKALAAATKTT